MFDWAPIKTSDLILTFAALAGPILAVQAQKIVEQWRSAQERRTAIFRTLMSTRSTRLDPRHVEALNAIPLDFYGDENLKDLWDEYFAHLCKRPNSANEQVVWNAAAQHHFMALLMAIGKKLRYKFNGAEMDRNYFPEAHVAIQNDQLVAQHCVARWLAGDLSVKIEVVGLPSTDPETSAQQEELRVAAVNWLKGGTVPSQRPPHQAETPNGAANGH